jgi:polyhydroxyalkanoate synthesis repressor PhaR
MPRKTIVIKKYENRRLYDTTASRYVNLEEVAAMVQEGHAVQVVDASTGEDLTRQVLTQIIAEYAKTPNSTFPLDVLRQMVVATGKATQENTMQYMKAMLDMYQSTFRAMTPTMNPFEFMARPTPAATEEERRRDVVGESRGQTQKHGYAEVQHLKQRVEELEALVSKGGRKRPGDRHKSRRRTAR